MEPTKVVLLTTSGCHLCEEAREALEELTAEFPLAVRVVDAASPEGTALIARYRPAFQPLVLVDGSPFSAGRLPRKKLRRALERMAGSAA